MSSKIGIQNTGELEQLRLDLGVQSIALQAPSTNTEDCTQYEMYSEEWKQCMCEHDPANCPDDVLYFFHSDQLGSSSYLTDAEGNPYQFFIYLPWGEVLAEQKAAEFSTPYQFNGKELDQETGLYNYGARYYDPSLSVWLGVDPLADQRSWMTPYSYVQNNPLNRIDPDGRLDNPIYGENGDFLGTDDKGLRGEAIIMNENDFTQGMSHDEAMSKGTTLSSACDSECISTGVFDKVSASQSGINYRLDKLDNALGIINVVAKTLTKPGYPAIETGLGIGIAQIASSVSGPNYGIGAVGTPLQYRHYGLGSFTNNAKMMSGLKFLRMAGTTMAYTGLAASGYSTLRGDQSVGWFAADAVATRVGFMGWPGAVGYGFYQGNKWLYTDSPTDSKMVKENKGLVRLRGFR